MKQYELIKATESTLRMVVEKDVCVQDVKNLSMYEDYKRLKEEGLKVTYIVNYLCSQYCTSEPTIYRIIKRMEKDI